MGSTVSDLIRLLTNGRVRERISAAESLGRHASENSRLALVKALEDKNYRIRSAAVEALGAIGGPEAVSALVRSLSDRDTAVQISAAEQLGELGAKEAVDDLADLLRSSPDSLVRTFAAASLGAIGDQKAVPAFLIGLKDHDALVRGYSAEGLGLIGARENIPAIEAALNEESSGSARVRMYESLFALGQKEVLPQITKMLKSKSYRVRCATANILAGIADESNSPIVKKALQDAFEREQTVAGKSSIQNSLLIIGGSEP